MDRHIYNVNNSPLPFVGIGWKRWYIVSTWFFPKIFSPGCPKLGKFLGNLLNLPWAISLTWYCLRSPKSLPRYLSDPEYSKIRSLLPRIDVNKNSSNFRTLKIRKEVFSPSETLNSPLAINLVFCQVKTHWDHLPLSWVAPKSWQTNLA